MPSARSAPVAMLAGLACIPAQAQDAEQLARKLANPVAAMISVPLQSNYDEKYGPTRDGRKFFMNLQSVVPVLRYWADSPDGGPRDWGLRLSVTFLFPR